MYIFLWICLILFISSLTAIIYSIYRIRNRQHDVPLDYVLDVDNGIQKILKQSSKFLKNVFGFIILGCVSLYRMIAHALKNHTFIQKIFQKIEL